MQRRGWGCTAFLAVTGAVFIGILIAVFGSTGEDTGPTPPTRQGADTSSPVREDPGEIGDGVYLVGTDLEAGTYVTQGPGSDDILDSCYWARAKDDSGELGSIISNDNLTGQGRVTVKTGEIFELSGGCVWDKV